MTEFKDYDYGLLSDYGGGDVEWWQDYIRVAIAECNSFWREQAESSLEAEVAKLKEALENIVDWKNIPGASYVDDAVVKKAIKTIVVVAREALKEE